MDTFTNQSRAVSVEKCACPAGYAGLSCQVGGNLLSIDEGIATLAGLKKLPQY